MQELSVAIGVISVFVAVAVGLLPFAGVPIPQPVAIGIIVTCVLLAVWAVPVVNAHVPIPQGIFGAVGAGCLVACLAWPVPSPSVAAKGAPPLTLNDLFAADFPNTARYEIGARVPLADGQFLDIRWKRYTDASAKSNFLGLYVPRSPAAYDVSAAMADGGFKEALDHMNSTVKINSKVLGESAETLSDDLTFSGRLYLYAEDNFTPQQIGALTDLYQKQGVSLIIRGSDYMISRNLTRDQKTN